MKLSKIYKNYWNMKAIVTRGNEQEPMYREMKNKY